MYVLVKVDYDYHRFQENMAVFTTAEEAKKQCGSLEMYEEDSEREDFFDDKDLTHYWLQSFSSKEDTAASWWNTLPLSNRIHILELFNGININSSRNHLELSEILILWDFHNNNYKS